MQRNGFNLRIPAAISLLLMLVLSFSGPAMEMTDLIPDMIRSLRQTGFVLALLIAFISIFPFKSIIYRHFLAWPLLAVLVWCGFSLVWSGMPDVAGRRLVLTIAVAGTVLLTTPQLGYRLLLLLLRGPLAVMLMLSLIAVFALPDAGVQASANNVMWRGLLADKNIAGTFCALTLLTFNFDSRQTPAVLRWGVVALAAVFLLMTHSRTAWIACVLAIVLGEAIRRWHPQITTWMAGEGGPILRTSGWVIIAVICLGLVLVTIDRDILLSATADETMLSKRGAIWRPLVQTYLNHPLTGVGYGSFWQNDTMSAGAFGGNGWLHNVDQGHDGYLDLAVQIGLPGLLLALWAFVAWPVRRLVGLIGTQPERCALVSALLAFCLIDNLTESSMLQRDTFGNVFLMLCVALTLQLSRAQAEPVVENVVRRRRSAPAPEMPVRRRRRRRTAPGADGQ